LIVCSVVLSKLLVLSSGPSAGRIPLVGPEGQSLCRPRFSDRTVYSTTVRRWGVSLPAVGGCPPPAPVAWPRTARPLFPWGDRRHPRMFVGFCRFRGPRSRLTCACATLVTATRLVKNLRELADSLRRPPTADNQASYDPLRMCDQDEQTNIHNGKTGSMI
jgi:hypothetical protein